MEVSERRIPTLASSLILRIRINKTRSGFIAACICAALGLLTISFASPESLPIIGVVTILLIPLGLGLLFTGRLKCALTLVWINELFSGGSGHWLNVGPVSIRWLLLLALIVLGGVEIYLSRKSRGVSIKHDRPMFSTSIIFFGGLLPLWLVVYSVLLKGTPFWTAIGDVNYLLALLAYYALRQLLKRHFHILRGWIIGGVFTLALFFLIMSLAPFEFVNPVFTTIAGGVALGRTESGINRASLLFQILLVIGIHIGILYAIDGTQSKSHRLAGVVFMSLCISSYVFMFLRGALLGTALVVILFTIAVIRRPKLRSLGINLLIILALMGSAAFALYTIAVPEGITKFTLDTSDPSSFISNVRITQADQMLAAFYDSPLLGQGVGVQLPGYAQDAGLQFELQYYMVLYRFGFIAFSMLLVTIIWFFIQLYRGESISNAVVRHPDGKFMLAVLLSLLTILISGAFNPYLTAIFTPFLVILYLACKEFIPNHQSLVRHAN